MYGVIVVIECVWNILESLELGRFWVKAGGQRAWACFDGVGPDIHTCPGVPHQPHMGGRKQVGLGSPGQASVMQEAW